MIHGENVQNPCMGAPKYIVAKETSIMPRKRPSSPCRPQRRKLARWQCQPTLRLVNVFRSNLILRTDIEAAMTFVELGKARRTR